MQKHWSSTYLETEVRAPEQTIIDTTPDKIRTREGEL